MSQSRNLLSSILTILLTCPNSDTLVCYSNEPFLTVYCNNMFLTVVHVHTLMHKHAGGTLATEHCLWAYWVHACCLAPEFELGRQCHWYGDTCSYLWYILHSLPAGYFIVTQAACYSAYCKCSLPAAVLPFICYGDNYSLLYCTLHSLTAYSTPISLLIHSYLQLNNPKSTGGEERAW